MRGTHELLAFARSHARFAQNFWNDESGQDLLEYVLVASLLSLCAVTALKTLAGEVYNLYLMIQNSLSAVL